MINSSLYEIDNKHSINTAETDFKCLQGALQSTTLIFNYHVPGSFHGIWLVKLL